MGAQNPPGDPSGLAAPFTVTAKPLNPKYTVEVPVTVKGPPGSPFPVPVKVELENCAGRAAAIGLAVDTRTHRATAYEAAGSRNDRVTEMEIRISGQRRRHEPCAQHYCERNSDAPCEVSLL